VSDKCICVSVNFLKLFSPKTCVYHPVEFAATQTHYEWWICSYFNA